MRFIAQGRRGPDRAGQRPARPRQDRGRQDRRAARRTSRSTELFSALRGMLRPLLVTRHGGAGLRATPTALPAAVHRRGQGRRRSCATSSPTRSSSPSAARSACARACAGDGDSVRLRGRRHRHRHRARGPGARSSRSSRRWRARCSAGEGHRAWACRCAASWPAARRRASRCESTPGEGSTFIATLPMRHAAAPSRTSAPPRAARGAPPRTAASWWWRTSATRAALREVPAGSTGYEPFCVELASRTARGRDAERAARGGGARHRAARPARSSRRWRWLAELKALRHACRSRWSSRAPARTRARRSRSAPTRYLRKPVEPRRAAARARARCCRRGARARRC